MSELEPQFTPFDVDANDRAPAVLSDKIPPFAYEGVPYRADEFEDYLRTLVWGSKKPTFIVLHHTAIPSASYAKYPSGAVWDSNESGLSISQIKEKRAKQLIGIRDYYNKQLFWDRGPHLFVDDDWIWTFSPLTREGIHAREGNRDNKGNGYSIGIEIIGYFEHVRWPFAVETNVIAAVTGLRRVLGTFDYIDRPFAGGISAHRSYGKPACPGHAIQPNYYLPLFKSAEQQKASFAPAPDTPAPATVDSRFRSAWTLSGGVWKANQLTPGHPVGPAMQRNDGLYYQTFERAVARQNADGTISWLLLNEITASH